MLWLMHDGLPYGHLATPAGATSIKTLARLVHAPLGMVTRDLEELARHGVFSRTEAGVIYSRRMVRDVTLRDTRAAYGHLGADHGHLGKAYGPLGGRPRKTPLDGGIQNPVDGGYVKPPPASASASASATALPEPRKQKDPQTPKGGFLRFWESYPSKVGKQAALKAWITNRCEGKTEAILAALVDPRIRGHLCREGGKYIPNPATWLNAGRWEDEPPDTRPGDDRTHRNVAGIQAWLAEQAAAP